MTITGSHIMNHELTSGQSATMAIPLLRDDMSRMIGRILLANEGVGLLIDLSPPVKTKTSIHQEVFIAKTRPEECELGDLIIRYCDENYFLVDGMVFEHKHLLPDHIYERVG